MSRQSHENVVSEIFEANEWPESDKKFGQVDNLDEEGATLSSEWLFTASETADSDPGYQEVGQPED